MATAKGNFRIRRRTSVALASCGAISNCAMRPKVVVVSNSGAVHRGRQTRALAYAVSHAVKEAGGSVIGMEGDDTGEWVLVDCGQVVCHVLQPNVRDYYNLEEIWGGKELFLKAQTECAPHLMPHRAHKPEQSAE